MSNLEVGQKLWFVPKPRQGQPRFLKVLKVGRKWLELEERYKADITTLNVKRGDLDSGRCYMDKDAYELSRKTDALWSSLKDRMPYHPPGGVTYADIEQAAKLLKVAAKVAPF